MDSPRDMVDADQKTGLGNVASFFARNISY
jgi:hypothetical protein